MSVMVRLRALVPLILLGSALGCSPASDRGSTTSLSEALAVDTTGFARADPDYTLTFPRDHAAHPDFFLEWWYLTGSLTGEDGRDYGYQFTIFRNALAPPGPVPVEAGASEWRTDQLYSAHLAIADPTEGRFRSAERYARGAAGLGGAVLDDGMLNVWVEDWRMEGPEDLSEIRVEAGTDEMALSFVLRPAKPVHLQGDQGYSPKGREPGQASHYYSITRLETAGTVRLGGRILRVSGTSWFDREWSTSLLGEEQQGWDWFSLQLDDGDDLMYFKLRSDADQEYVDGSLVAPDGSRRNLNPEEVVASPTEFWTSPATGSVYPVAWTMDVPQFGLRLNIEAALPNQELSTRVRYWEGAVYVSGTRDGEPVSGRGYVELTGYES